MTDHKTPTETKKDIVTEDSETKSDQEITLELHRLRQKYVLWHHLHQFHLPV